MTPDTKPFMRTLADAGHYTKGDIARASDVLDKVAQAKLETIRVVFVDQHGILRGKTIVASGLASAFASGLGVPSTLLLKDTSHRTVFPVWDADVPVADMPFAGAGDVLLRPDPAKFFPLPWAPHSAMLFSDVYHRNGAQVAFSSGAVLSKAVAKLAAQGYRATFGLEVEFQVYQRIDPALGHAAATMPPAPPLTQNLTQGHQYLTETRYAEAEDLLDHLRRMSEELGLQPRSMEIEMGPSQFEFTFDAADPETQADRFVLFRTMVKEVCHARRLHASFMAKPNLPNAASNGWHIHQSLSDMDTGQPLFSPDAADGVTQAAGSWIAGLLDHASASCLLTNPTVNSYKRFAPFQLAPTAIQWARDNRGAMIRALLNPNDPAARIENRVPDTSANPYFAIASQILSGLDGLMRNVQAPAPSENPYSDDARQLPDNLASAIAAFEASDLYRDTLGEGFVDYLVTLKRAEWQRYLMTVSEWEQQEYFGLF